MRLLVTRPAPDAERQAEALRMRGHEVLVHPLLQIEFLDAGRLPLKGVQALVATSRNALRALARNEAKPKAVRRPLFVVGPATAAMAAALGFSEVTQGEGTAESLVPLIAGQCPAAKGRILHLAGERLAFDLKGALEARGLSVEQQVVYRALPVARLQPEVRTALADAALDAVVLMSPATARCWVRLSREAGLEARAAAVRHYCLSDAVAGALEDLGPDKVLIPEVPQEDRLLALIARDTAH
ncbi:MAG: uroporphyrinogen-III synthase [Alphaproteobacteria bacterium]|nr:MAG: uroporphyrinogen-III synthase [Alphaproteobacteria bacterium]